MKTSYTHQFLDPNWYLYQTVYKVDFLIDLKLTNSTVAIINEVN